MNELKTMVIQVASIEKNDAKMIILKDSNNLKYSMFKNKISDWLETAAYSKFKLLPEMGIGKTIKVAVKEEQKEYNGQSYIQRTIVTVDASIPQQSQITTPTTATTTKQSNGFRKQEYNDNAEWKVRFGFAIEAYKLGLDLSEETAKTINKWTDYVMTGSLKDPVVESIIEEFGWEEADINSEDVPF